MRFVAFAPETDKRHRQARRMLQVPLAEPVARALRTLNLPQTASWDDVKRRYRSLARHQHPDKLTCATESASRFREISAAYSLLSEEEGRAGLKRTGASRRPRILTSVGVAAAVVLIIIFVVAVVPAVTFFRQPDDHVPQPTHVKHPAQRGRRHHPLIHRPNRMYRSNNGTRVPRGVPAGSLGKEESNEQLLRQGATGRLQDGEVHMELNQVPFLEKTSAGYIKHAT